MEKIISIVPAQWSPEASVLLSRAVDHVADIARQVESARAQLFAVMADDVMVGAFVLRVDLTADGAEGVIVAAAGNLDGVRLISLFPDVEARFTGCVRLRAHTSRPGMVRALLNRGYKLFEFVMVKTC